MIKNFKALKTGKAWEVLIQPRVDAKDPKFVPLWNYLEIFNKAKTNYRVGMKLDFSTSVIYISVRNDNNDELMMMYNMSTCIFSMKRKDAWEQIGGITEVQKRCAKAKFVV